MWDGEFEKIWEENDGFARMSGREITSVLVKEYGFDEEKVRKFGIWFVLKGLKEGWLLDELGFWVQEAEFDE